MLLNKPVVIIIIHKLSHGLYALRSSTYVLGMWTSVV
jgi:hypothetical protein